MNILVVDDEKKYLNFNGCYFVFGRIHRDYGGKRF